MLVLMNIWGWIVAHKRLVGIAVSCIAGLLLIWYLFMQVQSCRSTRAIDKQKAVANASLANWANAQSNVVRDAVDVAVQEQATKDAVNAVLVTSNASVAVQTNTNAALANLHMVIAANKPVGVAAQTVIDQLKDLDGE